MSEVGDQRSHQVDESSTAEAAQVPQSSLTMDVNLPGMDECDSGKTSVPIVGCLDDHANNRDESISSDESDDDDDLSKDNKVLVDELKMFFYYFYSCCLVLSSNT